MDPISYFYKIVVFFFVLSLVYQCGFVNGLVDHDDPKESNWVRSDGRCGFKYKVNGDPGRCDPKSDKPCCSRSGRCVTETPRNCARWGCIDFRLNHTFVRNDLRCG